MTETSTRSILVAEEERSLRELYALELSSLGFQVEQAASGEEALEKLRAGAFDMLVTDLSLAGAIDGSDLLRRTKAQRLATDVVVVTGSTTLQTAIGALKDGASDYFTKPLAPAQIRMIAARCMASRGDSDWYRDPAPSPAPVPPPPAPAPPPSNGSQGPDPKIAEELATLAAEREAALHAKAELEKKLAGLQKELAALRPSPGAEPKKAPKGAGAAKESLEDVRELLRTSRRTAAEEKGALEEQIADLKAELAGTRAALDSSRRQSAGAAGKGSEDASALRSELDIAKAKSEAWRRETASLKAQLLSMGEDFDTRQVESLERFHIHKTGYEKVIQQLQSELDHMRQAGGAPPSPPAGAPAEREAVTLSLPTSIPGFGWFKRLRDWWSSI